MTVENDVNLISEETLCHCEKNGLLYQDCVKKVTQREREKGREREKKKRGG